MPSTQLRASFGTIVRSRGADSAAVILTCALLTATAACGSSGGGTAAGTSSSSLASSAAAQGSGPVNVLYAGSLVTLMRSRSGPAFSTATGYTFTGFSGGSTVARHPDQGQGARRATCSSAPARRPNQTLEGAANGNWVSWYATFASSPLVIGYNPNSKFAADLKTKPWYQVITEPGILLGRTDPATDPKGKLAAAGAHRRGHGRQNLPALDAAGDRTSNVFPEETLVGRLQSGQLDAGFFYAARQRRPTSRPCRSPGETQGHLHDHRAEQRPARGGRRGVRQVPPRHQGRAP